MHVAELAKWWSEAQEHAKPHLAAKAVLAYMREADGHTADLDELRELLTDNGVDASMQLHVLANMVDDGWLREGEGDEYYLGARGHEESQPEQGEEDSDASQLSTVRLALQPGEEYFTQPPGSGWEFVRQGPHGGHVYRPVTGQQAASQPTPSPAQQGGKPGLLARAAAGAAKAGKAIASTILSQLSPSSILERIKGAGHVLAHPVESIRKKYDSLYERYGPAGAMAIGGAYAAYYTAAALNPIMLAYPVPLTATILGSARVLRYGILKGRGKDVQFSLESPEADQADMLSEAKRLIADMAAEAGEEPPQIDDDLLAQVMAGLMQHGEEQPTEEQLSLIRLASKGHDDSAPSLFDTPAGEQSRETEAHDGKKPGEFAPKEKGSGQPAHKERANAIQAKKDELKQQLKQMRHEGFNSLKADATKAKDAAGEMTDTLNDHVDNLSWADEAETEPDEPAYNLDPDNPQPRENWDGLPEEESGGLSYEEALAQDKKDKAEYEQALAKQQAYPDDAANLHEELEGLTRTLPGGPDDEDLTPSEHFERLGEIIDKAKEMQGVDWTASGIFTPEELADQKQVIAGLIKDAKQAREHLRQYSRHRKEMDAIRRGETMELSLESADEAEYARILDAADDSDVDLDSGSPRLSLSTAGESLRDKVRRLARERYPKLDDSDTLQLGRSRKQPPQQGLFDEPSSPSLPVAATWTRYEGLRGGRGWKSSTTGRVVYRETMPGEHEHAGEHEPEPVPAGLPEFPATTYRGQGRADASSVYSPLAAGVGGVLGNDAEYHAFTPEHAGRYGPEVTEHETTLEKPLVVTSDNEWKAVCVAAGVPSDLAKANLYAGDLEPVKAAQAKLLEYLKSEGHDGVVVQMDGSKPTKRLGELFGHDQVVKFKGEAEVGAPEPEAELPVEPEPSEPTPSEPIPPEMLASKPEVSETGPAPAEAEASEPLPVESESLPAPETSPLDVPPIVDVGELETPTKTQNDARKEGARRSRNSVHFENPITGPSGAKLNSYDWKHMLIEEPNARGDDIVTRRVSDWEEAQQNEHTGKDVVHQFHVETPDGKGHVVSLETALKLMGFDDGSAGMNKVKNLAAASMQLAQLRQQQEELEADPTAGKYAKQNGRDRIEQLEGRVVSLTKEASLASTGVNPSEHYRNLHKKAMRLRDLFNKKPGVVGQWQNNQIAEIAKAAAPNDRQAQQRIFEEGLQVHRDLSRAARLNILGERHHKQTPVAEEIPETSSFGSKIPAVPAWSDAKMKNWYYTHGEDAEDAALKAEEWLEKYHPEYTKV